MIDRFGRAIRYLRISVTDRCNLRCSYCMPAEGIQLIPREQILSFDEIVEVARQAVALGVNKVRLTGGEPLVRRRVVELVARLARLPGLDDLAMTTNGVLLPTFAAPLRAAGLQRLNISLDTLDPERFRVLTRCGELDQVRAGLDAARAAGFERIKINCVIQASSAEPDARAVAEFGQQHGLEVRFIRRMDLETGQFWPVERAGGGDCPSCSRLRLSSNGHIFPCLFSNLSYDVRQLGVAEALDRAIRHKPESGQKAERAFHTLGG